MMCEACEPTQRPTAVAGEHHSQREHAHEATSEGAEATACSEGVEAQPAGTPLLSPTQTVLLEKARSACTR